MSALTTQTAADGAAIPIRAPDHNDRMNAEMDDGFVSKPQAEGQAKTLSHEWPRVTPEAKARIEACLALPCDDEHVTIKCTAATATITLRQVRTSTRVELQCDGCGRSLSGPIKYTQFPFGWRQFPAWRQDLVKRRAEMWEAEHERRRAEFDEQRSAYEAERERRRQEVENYLRWCQTSPQWHQLSSRVLWRCRGVCEACLTDKAATVHHLTYEQGRLPPAWSLRGVCHDCHRRLHANKFGESDDWAPC